MIANIKCGGRNSIILKKSCSFNYIVIGIVCVKQVVPSKGDYCQLGPVPRLAMVLLKTSHFLMRKICSKLGENSKINQAVQG